MKKNSTKVLASLFAGAGGLDLGLERAGFETVFANDIEEHACITLQENKRLSEIQAVEYDSWFDSVVSTQRCFKRNSAPFLNDLRTRLMPSLTEQAVLRNARIVCGDIRKISSSEIRQALGRLAKEFTLVAGGPPCQPFSRAGKRETVSVADGQLFLEFVRVVRDLRPRWMLFENVKGLLLHKTPVVELHCKVCKKQYIPSFSARGSILDENIKMFKCEECCNEAEVKISNPVDGSLRLILAEFERLGYTCKWRVLNAADYGSPQMRFRLFIVGSRDNEAFEWPRPTHMQPQQESVSKYNTTLPFEEESRKSTPRWRTMQEELWPNGHPKYGRLDLNIARLWVENVVRPHAEPVTWRLDRPAPTIGAHQSAKLAIAPFGVPEEQLKRQQWHVLGKRQGDLPPVEVEHEYLSDEELLRLQTFPKHWYLHGTRMQRAFQIGNAVPVCLAAAVGAAIAQACDADVTTRPVA